MSEKTELLPCPFCGSEPHFGNRDDKYWIQCDKCEVNPTAEGVDWADTVQIWNTRPALPLSQPRVESEPTVTVPVSWFWLSGIGGLLIDADLALQNIPEDGLEFWNEVSVEMTTDAPAGVAAAEFMASLPSAKGRE